MTKTVALQTDDKNLSTTLQNAGYKVVSLYSICGTSRIDVVLYNSYSQRFISDYSHPSDLADVSINQLSDFDDTSTKYLNISGLTPDKVLSLLNQQLSNSVAARGNYPFI